VSSAAPPRRRGNWGCPWRAGRRRRHGSAAHAAARRGESGTVVRPILTPRMVLIVGRKYHLRCIFTVLRVAVVLTALLAALQITLSLLIWFDKANRISSEVAEAYVYVALPSGLASLLTMGALQLVAAGVGLYGVINRFRAPLFAYITGTWQLPCRRCPAWCGAVRRGAARCL
jgi:hypothetical protein